MEANLLVVPKVLADFAVAC